MPPHEAAPAPQPAPQVPARPDAGRSGGPETHDAPGLSKPVAYSIIGVVALAIVGIVFFFMQGSGSAFDPAAPRTIALIKIPQVREADEGFKARMATLGYTNVNYLEHEIGIGPNFATEVNAALDEILAQDPDLIFLDFEAQAKMTLAKLEAEGRSDISMVFLSRLHDPITYGLIQDFSSSGNNSTGVATSLIELVQRHFEFLKQINPDIKKLGVFGKGFQVPDVAGEYYAEVQKQAPKFGIEIVEYTTDAPPPQAKAEFDRIAATIQPGDIDALMHIGGHYYATQEAGESNLAIRLGIPMATNYEDIPRGGHFTYSNGTREGGEQAAVMADKIFRGTPPNEIPIEYAQRGILSIHTGRAEAAGFEFPESMLYLAENVYEDDSQFPSFDDH